MNEFETIEYKVYKPEVREDGIYAPIEEQCPAWCMPRYKLIMTKENFVEAFKKYFNIKETEDTKDIDPNFYVKVDSYPSYSQPPIFTTNTIEDPYEQLHIKWTNDDFQTQGCE